MASTFLNTPEAAAWLRISPVTLARWRIEGQGPVFHRFGRRVLYAQADIMAWAEAQRRQSTSAAPSINNRARVAAACDKGGHNR